MTLDEYYSRWFEKIDLVDCVIVNVVGKPHVQRQAKVHAAPMGDFLAAYMEHLAIPWYRKARDWKLVEKFMRQELNKLGSIRFAGG